MNDYSLNIGEKFFSSRLILNKKEEGISLINSVLSRTFKSVVIKNITQVNKNDDVFVNEVTQSTDFLKYLSKNEIGEFVYIGIEFDKLICINQEKCKIIKYNITQYLENIYIQNLITAFKYDKELIISTLSREPLIPVDGNQLKFNNILLEAILIDLMKEISPIINSNTIILSGEIIWSNWAGQIGIVNILKKLPSKFNYKVYIDNNGLWKSLLTKRDKEKWLYKLSSTVFELDLLFINSLKLLNDKKIQLEGLERQFIVSPNKYANIIKYSGENFPKSIIINNLSNSKIQNVEENEFINTNIKETINIVEPLIRRVIEYKKDAEISVNSNLIYNFSIKNNTALEIGMPIASVINNSVKVHKVKSKRFISECVEKQLIHKGDLIGVEKSTFTNTPIYAKSSGKLILKYSNFGFILIEDNSQRIEFLSPCRGTLKTISNRDSFSIITDYLNISLSYQIGDNIYAKFNNSPIGNFSIAKYLLEFDPKALSIKEIIENNIKLIIIKNCDPLLIKKYLLENPILIDFVSFALIEDSLDVSNRAIDNLFINNSVNTVILEEGMLKVICDFSSEEYKKLKAITEHMPSQITKVIKYERKNNYGNILKSLSSTEKLVRFSQVESIEKNSNLINQSFKL